MQDKDALGTLNWLVEAGADEAIGENAGQPAGGQKPRAARAAPYRAKRAEGAAGRPPPPGGAIRIGDAIGAIGGATSLAELKAALESFEGCALKRTATNTVFADGTPAGRHHVHRRSAGARRRPHRQALCRPRRAIAGQDAGQHRAGPQDQRLYHQCHQLAPAGQSRSHAGGSGDVPALPAPPYRTGRIRQ